MSGAANRFIAIAAALLFAGYIATGWLSAAAGVGSLDSHGIMQVASERIHDGSFDESRPPGHPLNEYWMLPGFALLVGAAHTPGPIAPDVYGAYQILGGCFCLVVFWFLLGEAGPGLPDFMGRDAGAWLGLGGIRRRMHRPAAGESRLLRESRLGADSSQVARLQRRRRRFTYAPPAAELGKTPPCCKRRRLSRSFLIP